MDSQKFAESVCKILSDSKAQDVIMIDLRGKTDTADFFVVASGRSMTQTRSLIEKVEEGTEKDGVLPIREEGIREGRWAVMDYGDVIVHVFNDESRLFYHLEKLWGEENVIKFNG